MKLPKLLTTLCATLAIAGCQSRPQQVQSILPPRAVISVTPAPLFVAEAEAALARSDFAASASFAELAVRAQPAQPQARQLLAQAYLGGGRVISAEQTFGDLLGQNPGDSKARMGRALARLAAGDPTGAIADLDALNNGTMTPDAGLAYALAGDYARGVALLTAAARSETATPRTRQNLALALALSGQWAQARAIAAQDLDPPIVDERIRQWTAIAANHDPAARAATILAIVPQPDDSGRPAALAWMVPAKLQDAVVERGTASALVAVVEQGAAANVIAHDAEQPSPPVPVAIFTSPQSAGRWVVQLGAYASERQRDSAWSRARISKISSHINLLNQVHTRVISANGVTLHRLSVGSFADRKGAGQLCEALRRTGAECLVRHIGEVAPTQLAARF